MTHDDWLDDNEYPSDEDIDDFGDDSPVDYDPLTVGYVSNEHPGFWTTGHIIMMVVIVVLLAALLLPSLL